MKIGTKIVIDRKNGPKISTDFDLNIKGVEQSALNNGLEFYEVNAGTQSIIKLELVFRTGRVHETQIGSAKAAFSLIREGSTRHNSEELAEFFDYYGAVVKSECGMETSSISLVVVERYFDKVWPIWLHMVLYPLYADQEVDKYKQVFSQKLLNQLAKNDVQSYRIFTENIFGSEHPYGYNTEANDILQLTRDSILGFYNTCMGFDKAFVILCGKYNATTRATIVDSLTQIRRKSTQSLPQFVEKGLNHNTIKVPTQNDVQIAIKTGRRLFPRLHPHFNQVQFMNMVLGGYFGSRLMKNIREEKGYTYGIYSAVHSWQKDGFMYISADVANAYLEDTLKEINIELEKLRDTPVGDAEFAMVQNYILGQSLHLLDGPFAKGDLMKKLTSKHLTTSDFHSNVQACKEMTPADIQQMAQLYLDPKDFTTVLTGDF